MLNFKNDCNCCGIVRKHPKPRWHGCLNFKKPSCPRMNTTFTHNVSGSFKRATLQSDAKCATA